MPPTRTTLRRRWISVLTVVVVLGGAAGFLLTRTNSPTTSTTRPAARTGRRRDSPRRQGDGSTAKALQVVSISPSNGTTGASASAPITITLSAPLADDSPMPTLDPGVPGSWHTSATTLTFTPSEPFVPLSQVTLTLPGGPSGIAASDGGTLRTSDVDNFTIANGSTLRLQQLLSLLDYSPLSWSPSGATVAASDTAGQLAALYAPPSGSFVWRNSGWPSSLSALWEPGTFNVFTRGLVMSFQADHGLIVNGTPSGGLWNDLLSAIATNDVNTGGYTYAVGNKTAPQTLTIYHDGTVVLHTSANTGIPQSPTPSGTFPVYARYRNYVMRGTNPDGVAYADPVQFVAYFYDGDAVHYFPRADYGIPQSLGCIELPLAEAAIAWPYLAYGTLVTVVN